MEGRHCAASAFTVRCLLPLDFSATQLGNPRHSPQPSESCKKATKSTILALTPFALNLWEGFDPVIGNKLSGVIGDTLLQGFARLWRGY